MLLHEEVMQISFLRKNLSWPTLAMKTRNMNASPRFSPFPSVCLNNNETLDMEFHSMALNLKFILQGVLGESGKSLRHGNTEEY